MFAEVYSRGSARNAAESLLYRGDFDRWVSESGAKPPTVPVGNYVPKPPPPKARQRGPPPRKAQQRPAPSVPAGHGKQHAADYSPYLTSAIAAPHHPPHYAAHATHAPRGPSQSSAGAGGRGWDVPVTPPQQIPPAFLHPLQPPATHLSGLRDVQPPIVPPVNWAVSSSSPPQSVPPALQSLFGPPDPALHPQIMPPALMGVVSTHQSLVPVESQPTIAPQSTSLDRSPAVSPAPSMSLDRPAMGISQERLSIEDGVLVDEPVSPSPAEPQDGVLPGSLDEHDDRLNDLDSTFDSTLKEEVRDTDLAFQNALFEPAEPMPPSREGRVVHVNESDIVAIQSAWRGYLARKRAEGLRCEREERILQDREAHRVRIMAAVCMQACWRSYAARCLVARRHEKALAIQVFWKLFLVYKRIMEQVWRRRKARAKAGEVVKCIVTIQRFWRSYKSIQHAKRGADELRKQREDFYRFRDKEEEQSDSVGLQARQKDAAVQIQQFYVGYREQRKLIDEEYSKFRIFRAALAIQCAWRRSRAVTRCRSLRAQRMVTHSAVKQSERVFESLRILQQFFRLMLARRKVARRRARCAEEQHAALSVQRVWRGHSGRKYAKYRRELRESERQSKIEESIRHQAGKILFRFFRTVHMECEFVRNGRRRLLAAEAAVKLQKVARGFLVRRHRKSLYFAKYSLEFERAKSELIVASCIRIQAQMRRFLCRNIVPDGLNKRYSQRERGAIVIQKAMRRALSSMKVKRLKLEKEMGKNSQHGKENLVYYINLLQRNVLMFLGKRRAASMRVLKGERAKKTIPPEVKNACCIKIQRAYRNHLASRKLDALREVALHGIVEQKIREKLNAKSVIAYHWRAHLKRKR